MVEIKKADNDDIPAIVDIWCKTSIQAHSFIPNEYWEANKKSMKDKYLPMAETYIATDGETILGFISLLNDYLAAIFVSSEMQGKGIGSMLLDYAKKQRNTLQLKVFSKNKKSIEFYKNKNFSIISESKDKETDEKELTMQWHK